MQKNWKVSAIACMIILIVPVLITFIASKINVNKNSQVPLSGKTIVIEHGGYVAEMDMENFIPCVLMAQMPIDSPKEVLKAQSVIIRTYILKQMGNSTSINSKELNLPFTTYVELEDMWFRNYRMEHPGSIEGLLGNLTGLGKSTIFKQNMDYLNALIEKTSMNVLKSNGELILPLFHEISNGVTRSGSELLGKEYDYLKSIKCNTDLQQENFIGAKYITMEQLKEKLAKKDIIIYKDKKELFSSENIDLQDFVNLIDSSNKDQQGYLVSIKIADTKIIAEEFADALELASTSMEISEYEKGLRITTRGVGHGFGMSLAYAGQLAKDGMGWQKILKTFYNATISDY
ncbi:MAG: SpoIID/LytB domain-containing protein [Eubacterium sp.]